MDVDFWRKTGLIVLQTNSVLESSNRRWRRGWLSGAVAHRHIAQVLWRRENWKHLPQEVVLLLNTATLIHAGDATRTAIVRAAAEMESWK